MRIIGLQRLNKESVKQKAKEVLEYYDARYFERLRPTPVTDILQLLKDKHNLQVDYDSYLGYDTNGNRLLGYFSPNPVAIGVDKALQQVGYREKFNFVAGHETGHMVLHRKLVYEDVGSMNLEDTDRTVNYDGSGRKQLSSDLDFLEWQANYFSSVFLVPDIMLITALTHIREKLGLGRRPRVYIDNQPVTQKDYYDTISELGNFFRVSRTVIRIRLEDLNLIEDRRYDPRAERARTLKSVLLEILDKVESAKQGGVG